MIVAVRDLSRAARIDDVELRSDLISRAEPRFADERNHRVATIVGEDCRGAQAQLTQRLPKPFIGPRFGAMIAPRQVAQLLLLNDRPKLSIILIHRRYA